MTTDSDKSPPRRRSHGSSPSSNKPKPYEQKLRQFIVDVKDQLAAGNPERALSMLNEALRYIDNATDVVAPADRVLPH